ncbi:10077_t:CDS:2, partial [Dentiscutata erythropus]
LNEFFKKLKRDSLKARIIRIYSDVVQISNHLEIRLIQGGALCIIARKLEIKKDAKVTFYYGHDTLKFIIYSRDIPSEFKVNVVHHQSSTIQNQTVKEMDLAYDIDSNVGANLTLVGDKSPYFEHISNVDDTVIQQDNDCHKLLRIQFQIAVSLLYDSPNISSSIFKWICAMSVNSIIVKDLYIQSMTLLVNLSLRTKENKTDSNILPILSPEKYKNVAKALIKSAEAYEEQYNKFCERNSGLKETAERMLKHYRETKHIQDELLGYTKDQYECILKAEKSLNQSLMKYDKEIKTAASTFESGVQKWKHDKVLEIMIQGTTCLISLASNCGTPVDYVKSINVTVDEIMMLNESLDNIKILIESLKNSNEISENYETFKKTVLSINDDKPYKIKPNAIWDEFLVNIEGLLETSVELKVAGAKQFLIAFKQFALHGKAYTESKIEAIYALQNLTYLQIQKAYIDANEKQQLELIKSYESNNYPNIELALPWFEKLMSIKCWIVVILQNYIWAYKNDQATIEHELADALTNRFRNPPQNLTLKIIWDQQDELCKTIISELIENKTTTFEIKQDTIKEFRGLDRIRITAFRVFLKGIKPQEVHLKIVNNGIYEDRYDGEIFRFISEPLIRLFRYHDDGRIIVDSTLDENFKNNYYVPTPFSKWTISIEDVNEHPCDLEGLISIEINFEGSFVYSQK